MLQAKHAVPTAGAAQPFGFFRRRRADTSAHDMQLKQVLAVCAAAAEHGHSSMFPSLPFDPELRVIEGLDKEGFCTQLRTALKQYLPTTQWHRSRNPKMAGRHQGTRRPTVELGQCPDFCSMLAPTDCSEAHRSIPLAADPELGHFAGQPLTGLQLADAGIARQDLVRQDVDAMLPFSLKPHSSAARTGGPLMDRFSQDIQSSAERYRQGVRVALLSCFTGDQATAAELEQFSAKMSELLEKLTALRDRDFARVQELTRQTEETANRPSPTSSPLEQLTFMLQRRAGSRARARLQFLIASTLSTAQTADLRQANPHLSEADIVELNTALALLQFHTVRLAQLGRCIRSTQLVRNQLRKMQGQAPDQAQISHLRHMANALAKELLAERAFVDLKDGQLSFPPTFLTFEFSTCFMLRRRQYELVQNFLSAHAQGLSRCEQMIMGQGKTTVIGPLLSLILTNGKRLVTQVVPGPLLVQSRNVLRACFSSVISKRVYTLTFNRDENSPEMIRLLLDKLEHARVERAVVVTTPESIKSIMLTYLDMLNALESRERQSGGADERPAAQVQRPQFEPGQLVQIRGGPKAGQYRVLAPLPGNVGVVVMNMNTLTMDELMYDAMGPTREGNPQQTGAHGNSTQAELVATADMLAKVLRLFGQEEGGIGLVDEVDLVLHPLKSELNYPIFHKQSLDLDERRWRFAFFLLDGALFHSQLHRITVEGFVPDAFAETALNELAAGIKKGIANFAIQLEPHTVLLQRDFYAEHLKQPAAKWAAVWLLNQPEIAASLERAVSKGGVGDASVATQADVLKHMLNYMTIDMTDPKDKATQARDQAAFDKASEVIERYFRSFDDHGTKNTNATKLMNLARAWVTQLLPHCWKKVHRVSYGLLRPGDPQRAQEPLNRKLLAVPFVGKVGQAEEKKKGEKKRRKLRREIFDSIFLSLVFLFSSSLS